MNKLYLFRVKYYKITYLAPLLLFLSILSFTPGYSASHNSVVTSSLDQAKPKTITLKVTNKSIRSILVDIQHQAGLGISSRDNGLIDKLKPLSLNVKDASVTQVLDLIFANTGVGYKIEKNVMSFFVKQISDHKKKFEVVGKIFEKGSSKPIEGATVILKGTNVGTVSDSKGEFRLTATNANEIQVMYMAMQPYIYEGVLAENKPITIYLETKSIDVDEVVITGMFNKPKESYTGAVTFISKQDLVDFKSRNLLRTIANIDPSFNIVQNNNQGSNPNVLPEINIRGVTNLPSMDMSSKPENMSMEDFQTEQRAQLNTPLFILDGFEISLERMMDLDEEEIENVTILKDASSTAIYGSRGSNGVVVITSVKPQPGKLTVNVRAGFNLEVPDLTSYDILNAREKLDFEVAAGLFLADPNSVFYYKDQDDLNKIYNMKLRNVMEGVDTYWLSQPLRTGLSGNYGLSLSGGDRTFRYSLSASYNTQTGVMKGSARNNFNGTLNISYLYKSLQFANSVSVGANDAENSLWGDFSDYSRLNPYYAPYDDEGNLIRQFFGTTEDNGAKNPMYNQSTTSYDKSNYLNIRNNTSVEWAPVKHIKIGGRMGYSIQNNETHRFSSAKHNDFTLVSDPTLKGSYKFNTGKTKVYDLSLNVSYAEVFDQHSVFVGVNAHVRESKSILYNVNTIGYMHDRLDFFSMASDYKGSPGGSESTSRSMGLTANVNYNWNKILFIDASYRMDGASSFGPYSRFKPFYTAGCGWTPSGMKVFREHLQWVQTLRFRYNYGVTGSLPFQVYDALTTYKYIDNDRYEGALGAEIMGYGNPNLSWQFTYSHNLGGELSLFNGKVSIDGNIYTRLTRGSITTSTLTPSHGYTKYTENEGDIKNYGYDVAVSVRVINDRKRQISWNLRGSFAQNNNVLVKLSSAMKTNSDYVQRIDINNTNPAYLYKEGESMNAMYVVTSLGINPATGREMFLKRDGTVSYSYDNNDKVALGLNQPKINGTLSSSFRYQRFSFNVSFALRLGGQAYNTTLVDKVENANIEENVDRRVFEERWSGVNQYAKYKGWHDKTPSKQSSRFMQNESTLTCNSLNLAYTLSSKWIKKELGVQSVSISANTSELFQISTIKKERGISFPFSRRVSLQLSLTF